MPLRARPPSHRCSGHRRPPLCPLGGPAQVRLAQLVSAAGGAQGEMLVDLIRRPQSLDLERGDSHPPHDMCWGRIKVEQNKWTWGGRRRNEVHIEKHDDQSLIEKMRFKEVREITKQVWGKSSSGRRSSRSKGASVGVCWACCTGDGC